MYAVNVIDLAVFAREYPMIHAILFPSGTLADVIEIGKRIDGFICPFVSDECGLNTARIFEQRYPRGRVRFYEKSASSWRAIRPTVVFTRRAEAHDGDAELWPLGRKL